MTDLVWSPRAVEDLLSIRSDIDRESPHYGALVAHRIAVAAVERLRVFPESGHIVPEIGDPMVREVVWRDYRVIYRVGETSVQIVTVLRGTRLPVRD